MLELQRPDSLVVRVVNAIRTEIDSGRLAPESVSYTHLTLPTKA